MHLLGLKLYFCIEMAVSEMAVSEIKVQFYNDLQYEILR